MCFWNVCHLDLKVNLEKLFPVHIWIKFLIRCRSTVPWVCINRKCTCYAVLIFLSIYSALFRKKQPLSGYPKTGALNLEMIFLQNTWKGWVAVLSKYVRWMHTTVLKIKLFTSISPKFLVDLKQRSNPFLKFSEHLFYRKSFFNWRTWVLCNGLYNVI